MTAARAPVFDLLQRATWVATLMGIVGDVFRFAERSIGPLIDLLIRLWLAQLFLVSGILKVSNWETALYLSRYEYPVSWLEPVTAAYLGAAIELICPLFFALGLATRLAAIPMFILALVIHFNYVALDAQLFWAALFGWYIVRGAGALSLDRAFGRGLVDTALPLTAGAVRTAQWVSVFLAPIFQLGLRVWVALALVGSAGIFGWAATVPGGDLGALARVLPIDSAVLFPAFTALVCAALLSVGLCTRLAALGGVALALAARMTDPAGPQLYWLALFGLFVLYGPGKLSFDALVDRKLRRLFPQLDGKPAFSLAGLPRVVIVGAGFGGVTCAAALRRSKVDVTLIDRHNYHLFQPLLYQVATAGLTPSDIATPIRGLFREYFNVRVLMGAVTGVDTKRQAVQLGQNAVPYDYLVLASGARHSYFGRDEWEPFAPGLKRIEDATEVRGRMLLAFERAEQTEDAEARAGLLTFLIVGGGPTGVELAGAIVELARFGMEKEFRHFDPASARVILVQAGDRILPSFPEQLSRRAQASLERLGVKVMTNSRVEHIDAEGVLVSGARIEARTVLWAAGVVASSAAKWIGAESDRAGRIKVEPDLSVPGLPNIFAIGDTAWVEAWKGQPVPGLAPAAKQGGNYVAKVIQARVNGRKPPGPFRYRHLGSLATIGRKSAVVDFGWVRLSGVPAWWLWGIVHVGFLVGLRNRISVMFDWFWSYLTYRSGSRLITGNGERAPHSATKN